jgi:aspartate ammonia-lyase
VSFSSEAAQLELNVMEPVMVQAIFESVDMLNNAMDTLRIRCIDGITDNEQVCKDLVYNSIGLVTALNPYIGYDNAAKTAKKAYKENISLKEACVSLGFLTEEKFDEVFKPEEMCK